MPRQSESLDPSRFVDIRTLAIVQYCSVRTIWRQIADGTLPRPTHPGKPHLFDMEAVVAHAERTDPYLSVRLVGAWARIRQARKVFPPRVAPTVIRRLRAEDVRY